MLHASDEKIYKMETLYISVLKASETNKACKSKWSFTYFNFISITLSPNMIASGAESQTGQKIIFAF